MKVHEKSRNFLKIHEKSIKFLKNQENGGFQRVLEGFRKLPETLGSRLQGIQAPALAGARAEPKSWISDHFGDHFGDPR